MQTLCCAATHSHTQISWFNLHNGVNAHNSVQISLLTGAYKNKIAGVKGKMDYNADLCIDGDVLMVAKYRGRSIHYYQLLTDNA